MAHVHFVGSVALDTPEEVFAAIGQHCGPFLRRVPDGEPGGRRLWISWQIPVLRANPLLAPVGEGLVPLKLADGVAPEQLHFGELGYYVRRVLHTKTFSTHARPVTFPGLSGSRYRFRHRWRL